MRKDRYKKKRSHAKSLTLVLTLVLSCVLLVFGIVGTTLAWLTHTSETVTNTFTAGDINITLTETASAITDGDSSANTNSYKMVPGSTISKDPKVQVLANSEACYLFVKIVEGGTDFDKYLSYSIADGWTVLTGVDDDNDSTVGNETVVIYRQMSATNGSPSEKMSILFGDNIIVNNTVTKAMMDAIETSGRPTLSFTAYAVQSDNIGTVHDAWKQIDKDYSYTPSVTPDGGDTGDAGNDAT